MNAKMARFGAETSGQPPLEEDPTPLHAAAQTPAVHTALTQSCPSTQGPPLSLRLAHVPRMHRFLQSRSLAQTSPSLRWRRQVQPLASVTGRWPGAQASPYRLCPQG